MLIIRAICKIFTKHTRIILLNQGVVDSFLAGVDIFAVGHTQKIQNDIREALKDAVASGHISEERIDASLRRIFKVKKRLETFPDYSIEDAVQIFGSAEHTSVLEAISFQKP